MRSRKRNIDSVWERLFNHFNILEQIKRNGKFIISATQIKEIGKYEARLSAKFDKRSDLPIIFQEHNLSILPISRGNYTIGHYDVFANLCFNDFDAPIRKSVPDFIESIDLNNITSEAIALNIAYASGMINDVLDEDVTFLTLSGRMSSGTLKFKIKNKYTSKLDLIEVKNAQIEIDGGFEGTETIGIIEAKNDVPMDFMVRQLYYPYLLIQKRLPNKKIKPIFFTYSKGVFSFHVFEFMHHDVYSSIRMVKQKNYTLDILEEIEFTEIMDIYHRTKVKPEPRTVSFPQADYFGRIMNLLDFLNVPNGRSKDEITEKYSFSERQSDYYWTALVYLGFADKQKRGHNRKLNDYGKKVANEYTLKQQKLAFVKAILERATFREYFERILHNGGQMIEDSVAEEILIKHIKDINDTTLVRRSLTLKSWVHWIYNLIRE